MNNINPDTSKPNKEIILGIMRMRVSRYSDSLALCRNAFSEESVHSLRVSIRRLITIIRIVNKIIPRGNIPHLLSSLKSQLKIFNPLRDTQVMILKAEEMAINHPELGVFGSELRERENAQILSLKNQIQQFSFSRIEPAVRKMSEHHNAPDVSDRLVIAHAINTMNSSFTKVVELDSIATIDSSESLHKVRLAFKKFRYRTEVFSELINYPESRRKELGKFQDMLGAIQDNSVLINSIKEFSISKHLENEFSQAIIEINAEGAILVNNYFSNSKCLFDFWALPVPPALMEAKQN